VTHNRLVDEYLDAVRIAREAYERDFITLDEYERIVQKHDERLFEDSAILTCNQPQEAVT
jgi:hypothetical protein